jgi:long-chain acyl-CoA synthetase
MTNAMASSVELLTAQDAEARQRRAAGALAGRGLRAGDRVVFCMPSSAGLLCAVLGAARTGIVPVLLNATLLEHERDLLIADADPRMVVADDRALNVLDEGSPIDLAPHPLTRPMHYTSGTTGRPKGVNTGLWDEATAKEVFDDEADLWNMSDGDLHLICSPMYHTVSIRFATGTLLRGGSCVILGRFDASAALRVLRERRPSTTFMVPTHLTRLMALGDLGGDERFDSLRLLAHAGESCPPTLKRALMERVRDGVLWEFYGSTEGQFTVCTPQEWLEHPGTVGRARPGRRLFTDSQPEGVIWCEAPSFTRFSYWRDPGATARAWRGNAFTAGDVGRLDDEGYLYISGRRHDLIISGGVNVYPAEVESALREVPGVEDVAVFGLDDPHWGQKVCAAVVAGSDMDVGDLEESARKRLAPYKRPKQYFWAKDLPHTATGKLLRRKVAERLGITRRPEEHPKRLSDR